MEEVQKCTSRAGAPPPRTPEPGPRAPSHEGPWPSLASSLRGAGTLPPAEGVGATQP